MEHNASHWIILIIGKNNKYIAIAVAQSMHRKGGDKGSQILDYYIC